MRYPCAAGVLACLLLAAAAARAETGASPGGAAAAFNPAIGLILNGRYMSLSQDPQAYRLAGLALPSETGPGKEGLSLGESEINLSASVDDKFYGSVTVALSPDSEAEIEEAYVQTLALPYGLTLRAGRFYSRIGYLNELHPHVDDFADRPLAYRALLGEQFGDDGVQLRWIAPLPLFVEVGAEVLRGDAFPAGGAAGNGSGTHSVFVHAGGDVGVSHSWTAGVSRLHAEAEQRATGDVLAPDIFTGNADIVIADVVWKWAPGGNATRTHLKLQAEYLRRTEDGVYADGAGIIPPATRYTGTQHGWYAQTVYQFMPRWRVAVRYDRLTVDDPGALFAGTFLDPDGQRPRRVSTMLDFSNSEYSRLRVQYSRDESRPGAPDDQWTLQYVMSLGAHGAHRF